MRITSKILYLTSILIINQCHSMVPRACLALKELQKASCLKKQSFPIRVFTRSNHAAITPIVNAPKNSKVIAPVFLAAIGGAALLADSKPDNQFLQNANELVQDVPLYVDFLENYITTSMENQSIEKLYEFVRNQSKKLPKTEQKRIFNLFITQWCQQKLQPVLENERPFSQIEKTVIQLLKEALEKSPQPERYQQIQTLTDAMLAITDKDHTRARDLIDPFFELVTIPERVSLSLKILDSGKPLIWNHFFSDLEKVSRENNSLATQAHATLLTFLEKVVQKISQPNRDRWDCLTLHWLPVLPIQTKKYLLTYGSPQLLASLLILNGKLFTTKEISLFFKNNPELILNTIETIGLLVIPSTHAEKAISKIILEKSNSELFNKLFKENVMQLSEANRAQWTERFEKENYNALTQAPPSAGALFSNHLEKHNKESFLIKSIGNENFYNLLPAIVDYTKQQYCKNRIVLFHGQSSDWIFLEKLYHRLYEQKEGRKTPADYKFLRFTDHSSLSKKDVEKLQQYGVAYHYQDPLQSKENTILFTNLHPYINDAGANSWLFALDNRDFSGTDRIDQMLPTIFKNLKLTKAYEKLQKEHPHTLTALKQLFNEAIQEQGGYGQLLVISLPQKLAEKCTYSTDPDGRPEHHLNNQKLTSSTVALAQNPNDAPANHQHALILTEEIINPEAAQKTGVQIVSFDPVAYWRTEKYCAFEKKLDEVVELLKELETKP